MVEKMRTSIISEKQKPTKLLELSHNLKKNLSSAVATFRGADRLQAVGSLSLSPVSHHESMILPAEIDWNEFWIAMRPMNLTNL